MVEYNLSPDSGSYLCQSASDYPTTIGYNYCGARLQSKQTLNSGSFPKDCTIEGFNDTACQLEDGSFVECACGFDSNLHCSPNPSSTVFDNF